MHATDSGLVDQVKRVLKRGPILVGETYDHVGRHVDARYRGAQGPERGEVLGRRVVAAHRGEHRIVARLKRYV